MIVSYTAVEVDRERLTQSEAKGHLLEGIPFLLEKKNIYLLLCAFMFCVYICVRAPEHLELELQTVVRCHAGAGN